MQTIKFKHPQNGLIKNCEIGFSWKAVLFGEAAGPRGKSYALNLLENGYSPVDSEDIAVLLSLGIQYDSSNRKKESA